MPIPPNPALQRTQGILLKPPMKGGSFLLRIPLFLIRLTGLNGALFQGIFSISYIQARNGESAVFQRKKPACLNLFGPMIAPVSYSSLSGRSHRKSRCKNPHVFAFYAMILGRLMCWMVAGGRPEVPGSPVLRRRVLSGVPV